MPLSIPSCCSRGQGARACRCPEVERCVCVTVWPLPPEALEGRDHIVPAAGGQYGPAGPIEPPPAGRLLHARSVSIIMRRWRKGHDSPAYQSRGTRVPPPVAAGQGARGGAAFHTAGSEVAAIQHAFGLGSSIAVDGGPRRRRGRSARALGAIAKGMPWVKRPSRDCLWRPRSIWSNGER
jgi:hypothetical protein